MGLQIFMMFKDHLKRNGVQLIVPIRKVKVLWHTSAGNGLWSLEFILQESVFLQMLFSWFENRIQLCCLLLQEQMVCGHTLGIHQFQAEAEVRVGLMQFVHNRVVAQFFMPAHPQGGYGKQ